MFLAIFVGFQLIVSVDVSAQPPRQLPQQGNYGAVREGEEVLSAVGGVDGLEHRDLSLEPRSLRLSKPWSGSCRCVGVYGDRN